MKKSILILVAICITVMSFAQNEKYVASMEKAIELLGAARSVESAQQAANMFERISNAEKEEWLPAYYNAYANVSLAGLAMEKGESDKIEAFVDKAQTALDKAMKISPDNSEIYALQGYVFTSRIWSNPMTAGAIYSPQAHEAFAKSIALDATNPRPYFLRAQLVYYTPAFWGGGAKSAYPDFVKADELFASFEKASSIHPDWGKGSNDYHLGEAKKKMEEE